LIKNRIKGKGNDMSRLSGPKKGSGSRAKQWGTKTQSDYFINAGSPTVVRSNVNPER